MSRSILVYGTVVIDRVRRINRFPLVGEYCEFVSQEDHVGGEAANTATALARWGANVRLAGNSIGDDDLGGWLAQELRQRGLDISHLDPAPGPAPMCEIYVDAQGERTMFGRGWSNVKRSWPESLPAWFTADPNHGEIAREAVQEAHSKGTGIYLLDFVAENDVVPPGSFWQSSTDWVGQRGDCEANRRAAEAITQKYNCTSILTDSCLGLVIARPESEAVWLPAFECGQSVDSTGSGDCFRAGVLFCLLQGKGIAESLAFGSIAGGLNARFEGASRVTPSIEEILRIRDTQPEIWLKYLELID